MKESCAAYVSINIGLQKTRQISVTYFFYFKKVNYKTKIQIELYNNNVISTSYLRQRSALFDPVALTFDLLT